MGHAKPGGEGKGSFPTTSGASGTDFKDEKLRQTEHSEYVSIRSRYIEAWGELIECCAPSAA
jgi:hypothetical protein